MKKWVVTLFLLFPAFAFSVDPGDIARRYFAEALIHWGNGEFLQARESLAKAMSGEVYLEDIPEFWYFLAKLDLEEGDVRKAREELNNVSLFAYRPEVAYLSKLIDTVLQKKLELPKITGLKEISVIDGFQNGIEYFYTPISVDVLDEHILVLDGSNDRLVSIRGDGIGVIDLGRLKGSHCRDVAVDKLTGWVYVATEKGKIWRITDLVEPKIELFASGYILPQLIGTDRIGRLYVLDTGRSRVSVLDATGVERESFSPSGEFALLLSATKSASSLAVLDAENKTIVLLDRWGNVEGSIPWPKDVVAKSVALDPFGNVFLLDAEGEIHFNAIGSQEEWKVLEYSSRFDGIRVSYPYLLAWSLKENRVVLFEVIHSSITLNLYIHSISVKPMVKVNLTYGVMTTNGEPVLASSRFTEIRDSGGRVAADLKLKRLNPQIHRVKDERDFFHVLPILDRGRPNVIVLETDKCDLGLEMVFPLLLKNVVLFSTCKSVAELAKISGGNLVRSDEVAELVKYLKNVRWPEMIADYTVSPPLTAGIKSSSVSLKIGSLEYSDTIYYLREMLEGGTTEESTSVEQPSE